MVKKSKEYLENKRQQKITNLKKKTELYKAQAAKNEALAEKREQAKRARRAGIFGTFGDINKTIQKTDKKIAKHITRKRGKKGKIGWL